MSEHDCLLFIPGPVCVNPLTLLEGARPVVNHRGPEFHALFSDVREKLKRLFSTAGEVIILTSSGTGAVEALAANFAPNRGALVINAGEFGGRLAEALRVYGAEVVEVTSELGTAPELEEVLSAMDKAKPDVVAFAYNDTSPGVRLSYIRELCKEVKSRGALTIVDAVSAVGGDELDIDAWGIDALAGASQKCLQAPPGLSFVALSKEAVERLSDSRRSVYFDLRKYMEYAERRETPFTPAVTLTFSLRGALERILSFGVKRWISMHAERARALYTAFEHLGLRPFVREPFRSRTVLSFTTPSNVSMSELRRALREKYWIDTAGGLGSLRDKILRIGVMGMVPRRDLLALASAVGLELGRRGVRVDVPRALELVADFEF